MSHRGIFRAFLSIVSCIHRRCGTSGRNPGTRAVTIDVPCARHLELERHARRR